MSTKKIGFAYSAPLPLNLEGGISFCYYFMHNSLMNVLQQIFTDYYEEIEYTLHLRKTEMENIDKMIHCGDPSFGGAMDRTTSVSFKLVNVAHRHCVFTIDESLREFFLKDRSLLACLFHSANSVISRMFYKMNKSKNFTPGFIMVLHTFGRDLKWYPKSVLPSKK